jgi:predicted permease
MRIDLGFQTGNRIAVDVLLPQELDAKARQRDADRYQQVLERISTMPGITAVGGTGQLPLSGNSANGQFRIDGGKNSGAYWPVYRVATPGYFQAVNIPLLRGRLFDETDGASTPQVAVISKTVADTVWPGQDPIGQRINYANFDRDPNFMTIIGIVADVRSSPEIPALGDVYVHYLQRGAVDDFTLVIHAAGQPENVAQQVMSEIRAMNSEASIRVQTMDRMFSANLVNRRFNFTLLTTFAGAALILALMGIYSVTAYSVAQRTQEIGVRLALGAQLGDITRLFLAEGAKIILVGVVTGLMAAAAASRLFQSLLFGVQTSDIPSYLIAVLPLVTVGLIASLLPARRASRVDPMNTIGRS